MKYVSIDYDAIVAATELAVCLEIGDDKVWLPFSTLQDVDSRDDLDEANGSVEVAWWAALDKGLV